MTDDHAVDLRIEVASRSPRPTGRVIAADGAATAFDSWLELLTVLQAAIGVEDTPAGAIRHDIWAAGDAADAHERSPH